MKYTYLLMCGACLLTACSGKLVTHDLTGDSDLQKSGWSKDGVVAYRNAWFYEDYVTTTLVNKDGKVIGRAVDKTCTPINAQKLALHADLAHPIQINFEHGLLENYKFGVTLTDEGALKSVNAESSPDRGETLKNLASAAASAAAIAAFEGAPPPCNDGLTLVGMRRYSFPPP